MIDANGQIERYVSDFARFEREADAPGWLAPVRRAGIERFRDLGFPTPRLEDWKYTNVAPVLETPFRWASDSRRDDVTPALVAGLALGAARLVFVNGRFAKDLSSERLPAGVRASALGEAIRREPERIEPHLGRLVPWRESAFAALATAFLDDGAFVEIADDAAIEEPLEVLFVSSPGTEAQITHPRLLVVAGRGSQAALVETHAAADGGLYFTNAVGEVVVGDGARLDHCRIVAEAAKAAHVAATQVSVGRDGAYRSCAVSLGGRFLRHDLGVRLGGDGADCSLDGLYLTGGEDLVDHHTVIDHARPHGTSRELYKGVLDGRSRAVFNGKVIVRLDAQKTDARQTNKNLLLSDRAEVDTKPELQILADDVKCSHGAAIGQLDEEQVFYFRSRGFGEEHARRLLTYGFVADVLRRIGADAVRDALERRVAARLGIDGGER